MIRFRIVENHNEQCSICKNFLLEIWFKDDKHETNYFNLCTSCLMLDYSWPYNQDDPYLKTFELWCFLNVVKIIKKKNFI